MFIRLLKACKCFKTYQ